MGASNKIKTRPLEESHSFKRGVFKYLEGIATKWELKDYQLCNILRINQARFSHWKDRAEVSFDQTSTSWEAKAIKALIQIDKNLSAIFIHPQSQLTWLKSRGLVFPERSPLDLLLDQSLDAIIFDLRDYLNCLKSRGA